MNRKYLILMLSACSLYADKAENEYEYLIITSGALSGQCDSFVEFNKRRCLRTKIGITDTIYQTTNGKDNQEKIRNCIKNEYQNNKIKYVLLAGDVDIVPARGFAAKCYFDSGLLNGCEDKAIPCDMYYGCLDGTWQVSGSQNYGEPGSEDIGYEVYIGRIPVDNATQLRNILSKTIMYSEKPVADQTTNCLLADEKFWTTNNSIYHYLDEMIGVSIAGGYETRGFDTNWKITKVYEETNSTWNPDNFIAAVKSSKTAWIDHLGHGNNQIIFKLQASDISTANFSNNGISANYFIVYSQSSHTGAFDNASPPSNTIGLDCVSESFIKLSTGAVAFISPSRYSVDNYDTANLNRQDVNHRFHRFFHDALFNKKIHAIGMMDAYAKEIHKAFILQPAEQTPYFGKMRWVCYTLNLLGDPALSVWTSKHQTLIPDYPSPLTTTEFTWDSKLPYAWVALLDTGGKIITAQMTDAEGKCAFGDEALKNYVMSNPDGKVKVRVKAHNYLPFEGELPIKVTTSVCGNYNKIFSFVNTMRLTQKEVKIGYRLHKAGFLKISIYNSRGMLVQQEKRLYRDPGIHTIAVYTSTLGNGVYYCAMDYDNQRFVTKFSIVK